jgi:hypothetical protein
VRKIYAESRDEPTHRVLMYSVASDADWWLIKQALGLRRLKGDNEYADRFGGYWYIKEYE